MGQPSSQSEVCREFELARELRSVGVLNDALDPWLLTHQVPESCRRAVQICCDEIIANVILHAGTISEPIRVALRIDDAGLVANFVYRSRQFDPAKRKLPNTTTPVSQRNSGGLGLHLVQSLSERFEFHEEDGHHHLRIEFGFPPRAADRV